MKLTADQRKARDKAFEVFEQAQDVLNAEIEAANSAMADLYVKLEAAQNVYNDAAEALEDVVHTIGSELTEEIGEKSDTWQESDAGAMATDLAEEYETFEISNRFEVEDFVEIDVPDNDIESLQADLHDDSNNL